MCEDFFTSLNPDMLSVAGRTAALMAILMAIWFLRQPLDDLVENKLLRKLQGNPRTIVHLIACFVTDKPVEHPLFQTFSEWVVILFLRVPALVLMFAAANNSLVMTSYPLEPSTLALFQFAQVMMAVGILTQTLLPLGGASIFGTFIYLLYAYDWKSAVDVLPVLTSGVIFVSSPWDSWRRSITTISREQMRWVRLILGLGFFVLGWMKIFNYYLTIGVADNFVSVMKDPMISIFSFGTSSTFFRENWIMAFSMAEVMTGFLLMVGVFSRVWCLLMVYLFAKLMLVDFGWNEIPHLYPIGAFMIVCFSNNLSDEFYRVEQKDEQLAREGKNVVEVLFSIGMAVIFAAVAVFPMLYLLTKVQHPRYFPEAKVAEHCAELRRIQDSGLGDKFEENFLKSMEQHRTPNMEMGTANPGAPLAGGSTTPATGSMPGM